MFKLDKSRVLISDPSAPLAVSTMASFQRVSGTSSRRPCPPPSPAHRYALTLYALDTLVSLPPLNTRGRAGLTSVCIDRPARPSRQFARGWPPCALNKSLAQNPIDKTFKPIGACSGYSMASSRQDADTNGPLAHVGLITNPSAIQVLMAKPPG
jgi:hypothetical protein